jgi:hypothetical protein
MRPLMKMSLLELQDLFNKNHSDNSTLVSLRRELEHRSTASARELKAQVEATMKCLRAATASGVGRPSPEGAAGLKGSVSPDPAIVAARGVEGAYLRLRSTFTEEGELLARWGMTPNLPQHLQELLFSAWGEQLRKSTTVDGRSAVELQADLARLAALRKAETRSHDDR